MAYLPSTPRPSINQPLEKVYNDMIYSNRSRGTPAIRSQLIGRSTNTYAWGQSVLAGSPSYASTDFINGTRSSDRRGNDRDSVGFRPFGQGGFTNRALNFARNGLGHRNNQYYG